MLLAGSLRVSLSSSFQFPQEWGIQGVERGLHNSLRLLPWIPAPRLHEDKLRGNDPPEADRGFGGVPQFPILPPRMGDHKGVDGSLRNWIPASAGMTKESVRLRRTEGLGVPPNSPISPQEWGPGG